jgi:CopG family transcriptional regulator/antitoxin EndoAI
LLGAEAPAVNKIRALRILSFIEVNNMANKVMVSFPEGFLAEVDRIARDENRSRSELLREAVRLYIQTRRAKRVPGDDPRVRQAVALQDAIARLAPGTGEDSTAEIRKWRETRS